MDFRGSPTSTWSKVIQFHFDDANSLLLKKSTYVLWPGYRINVLLPAGCRKDISAGEGGELLKTDFANFLNISNLSVKFNTRLYSPVISHSCFWRNFSTKTLNWVLRFLRVRASDFTLKILFWWLSHWIFFYIHTNLYNKTSSNQKPSTEHSMVLLILLKREQK